MIKEKGSRRDRNERREKEEMDKVKKTQDMRDRGERFVIKGSKTCEKRERECHWEG